MSISASMTSRSLRHPHIVYIREGGISSTSGRANRMRCRYVLLMVLWVLWSELLGDGKPEWNSIDTFNTEAACTEESQQRASRAKQNRKVLNSGPTHFTYRSVDGTYMLSYICVHDSLDPRPTLTSHFRILSKHF